MSISLIQERLSTYNIDTPLQEEIALKEIFQEIILAALGRTDFFKHAVFQGGTALRILYHLDRFSEDLDFLLQHADPHFDLFSYLDAIKVEVNAYGAEVEVKDRSKADAAVKKAFLKDASLGKVLTLQFPDRSHTPKKMNVKVEIDTNPPVGSGYGIKYLDFPFPSSVTVQDPPSLFAGKSHALLCREYTKGRDWYDFLWYVRRKTPLNFTFLNNACAQQGPWKGQTMTITKEWHLGKMAEKIRAIDWKKAAEDVRLFVNEREAKSLDMWTEAFFLSRIDALREYL